MVQSISPPFRPHYPWLAGEELVADELNAAIANAGHGMRVTDWLPGGQPDGVTDLAPYFQEAIDAAADADPTNRAAAPGLAPFVVPANPLPYIIGTGLAIPSHSHIIIEIGATLKIEDGSNQSCLCIVSGAANVLIELYGTLDGNASSQTFNVGTPPGASSGFISLGPCTNIFMDGGGRQGLITNFWHWPVNIISATRAKVRSVRMTNCGNTAEFAGITTRISVTGGSYVGGSGILTLSTAGTGGGPHGINVGDTFTWVGVPGGDPAVFINGEYVALTVPDAYTVTCNAGIGNAPNMPPNPFPSFPNAGRVGTCTRCTNVGFEDCYVADIRDIGMALYSGCTGGYIRNCELERASGPAVYCDNGQPASCKDCEISGNYTHDGRGGPGSAATGSGLTNYNSMVFGNIASNNLGGCTVGGDSISFYGNLLHNNIPSVEVSTGWGFQIAAGGSSIRANIFDNTIRDPLPAATRHGIVFLTTVAGDNTYDNVSGIVSLTTATPHNVTVGAVFYVQNLFGVGNATTSYLQLNGKWTCLSAPTSTKLTYQGPAGLGTVNLGVTGQIWYFAYPTAVAHIAAGTYTSDSTGLLTLTTTASHGYDTVNFSNAASFVLSSVAGTATIAGSPVPFQLTGLFKAVAGTVGSTLTLMTTPSTTFVLTDGRVLPANFGIIIDGSDYCKISDNRIGDYGSPRNLTSAIGGVWGVNGSSSDNYFGPRTAVDADVSDRTLGGVSGPDNDLVYNLQVASLSTAGLVNFSGVSQQSGSMPAYLPPRGLTLGWNRNSGQGEVNFYVGKGGGSPGGFNFLQVAVIHITTGTYAPLTGIVTLTTSLPHNVLPGGRFVISNASGTDTVDGDDIARLNNGHVANSDAAGSTLTFTIKLALTIATITGGTVVPSGGGGGLIDTSAGLGGVLFSVDGHGNAVIAGSLMLGTLPANAANDAGAAAAGVPVGGLYRNGSILMVRAI